MKRSWSPQSCEDDTPYATSLTASDDDSDVVTDSEQSQDDSDYDSFEESNDDVEDSKSRNSSTDPSTRLSFSLSTLSLAGHKAKHPQAKPSNNSTIKDYYVNHEDVNKNPHRRTQNRNNPPATRSKPICKGSHPIAEVTKPPLPTITRTTNHIVKLLNTSLVSPVNKTTGPENTLRI
ncbi:hypothetical protein HDU76_010506 [Blyttiomyces sp. JEL0837]|nr:hypothetical protein HDU76_010506 [Blyttiomyces sp. JEL0837]